MLRSCRAEQASIRTTIMSGLIISLCMSVGQVQSLKKRKRSHDDGLTAIAFAKEFQFDINTRGWQMFDRWKSNEPQSSSFGKITYSVKIGNRKQQHLLISGANSPLYVKNKRGYFSNWLYTVDTNSWQIVDRGDFPPLGSSPVLIQLCSKIFALEFDLISGNSLIKSWIFDTALFNWQKTKVEGGTSFWFHLDSTNPYLLDIDAVAVRQSQTNCQCSQSAFVLFHFVDLRSIMHEVRCVSREGTESYKFIPIKSDNQTIPRSRVKLVSSDSSNIVLFVPAEETLWKFENETWTNTISVPYLRHPFNDSSASKIFGCALAMKNRKFIIFNIRDKKVINFDLKNNEFIVEDVAGDIPNRGYGVVSSIVEDQNTIIVFTVNLRSERTRVWKFAYERKVWTWKRLPSPDFAPSYGDVSTYDLSSNSISFTPVSIRVVAQRLCSAYIWNLDLTTMQWWKQHVSNSVLDKGERYYGTVASSWIGSCCFVSLCTKMDMGNIANVWMYNATDNRWRLLVSNSSIKARYVVSFVGVNTTTAILFGGVGSKHGTLGGSAFDETWILHLQPMFYWRQATGDVFHSVRPRSRYNHAAVIMQSKMYVFGGRDAFEACLDDLWVFDIKTQEWSELTADNGGPTVSNYQSCDYSAATTPGQLLITVIYRYRHASNGSIRSNQQTWMFILHAKLWQLIASSGGNENLMTAPISKSFYWKGFLVMFDTIQINIKYLAVKCPAGFTSSNISDKYCNFCKKGYYRETLYSDSDCIPCPYGLTTFDIGARKLSECTVCDVDRCKYGKCVVDFNEGSLRPVCQCYVGFTGSTCQYPTYWLIGAGIVVFVAVASASITAYLLLLKRKRTNERVLQNEVTVLTNVWQIDEEEVGSEELIGYGASGSVYKALYRDIIVAVKKMVAVGLPKSIDDFETEIMFMRTVRHKNIVLFIGAGKSQPGDVPFLVMEYMERGSLRNVLYDLSIDIDYERKLLFAMDVARGMHFLHTLEPPRIHRDLKSDNLLVSREWIVKVADFGLGRDVSCNTRRIDGRQIRHRYRSDQQRISLLPKREGLSYAGVGTARWRAPELTLREPYDTAVDVYRYC